MGEVIVITSGKGGVGKTTTTANVGAGLSKLGKKVVIIDTDLGLRNLDVVMGMENLVVYNLVDVVTGGCRLKQALIRDSRYENLYLLPSAQTKDKSAVSPEQMKKLTSELKEEFDYILLDCPAGIEQGFQNAIAGADRALVVTTPEVSSIRDADRIPVNQRHITGHYPDLIITAFFQHRAESHKRTLIRFPVFDMPCSYLRIIPLVFYREQYLICVF